MYVQRHAYTPKMKRQRRLTAKHSEGTGSRRASKPVKAKAARRKGLTLMASVEAARLHSMRIADFYRPLKKPVTLRLDADVLAWFKKDGRRYQTRINSALRKVMEREMKAGV
jgi:uncharacterized protein (DUF4415 family)